MVNPLNISPINASEVEIELNDLSNISDINHSLVDGKKKDSKFRIYETNWQCPGITMAGCSCFVGFIGAIITAVGLLIALTQQDISYQWAGYAIAVIGAGILGYSSINFVAHCISCGAIGHHIPQRAFETNVALLTIQAQQLSESVNLLKIERDRWKSLVEGQNKFAKHQDEMTKRLSETLEKNSKELNDKINELRGCVEKLDKAEMAAATLEKQLNEIKASLINFGETNSQFKENLYNLDFMTEELKGQEVEWDNDLKDFSQGNNDYERLNNQADQLHSVLEKQLNVMSMFRQAMDNGFKKFAQQSESLDISDDKFKEGAAELHKVTLEKNKLIQTNLKLMETIEKFKDFLTEFEDPRADDLRSSILGLSESSEG